MRPMAHSLSFSQSEHGTVELGTGSPDVLVHNGKAWRADHDEFNCPVDGPEKVPGGHTQVLVNNKQATRVQDFLLGSGSPDQIQGDNQVLLGEEGVGLESPEGMSEFCKEWCQFETEWPSLNPDQRRARYKDMVGRMFGNFGAPQPHINFIKPTPDENGVMSNPGGYINIHSGEFGVGDQFFSDAKPGELRRITYHETRHGQQLFMGIRYVRQQQRKKISIWPMMARKNGNLIKAADKMPDFPPGSKEEAFAKTMADGYCSWDGVGQLGWANQAYDKRYKQIPGGADANRIDHSVNSACVC